MRRCWQGSGWRWISVWESYFCGRRRIPQEAYRLVQAVRFLCDQEMQVTELSMRCRLVFDCVATLRVQDELIFPRQRR